MATINGTALTRHGSRVPALPAKPAPAKATTTPTPRPGPTRGTAPAPRPNVTPAPTINTMIVCLPDELPAEALTAHQLDKHFGVTGTCKPLFWASAELRLWQRHQMIGLRKGRPAACAGGPVKLLDLQGMRHAAGVGAGIRYQIWQQIVHGTRPATPWPAFEARHLADPQKYTFETAAADFHAQARVNAMRMHAAATHGTGQPGVGELEMYQAGQMAYQHYSATSAITGDALLTADGRKLAPASDALTHRVTYLEQALQYLDTVEPGQRLLAVAL
jgi:hypothetical protein